MKLDEVKIDHKNLNKFTFLSANEHWFISLDQFNGDEISIVIKSS